jgi:hypothetical protein
MAKLPAAQVFSGSAAVGKGRGSRGDQALVLTKVEDGQRWPESTGDPWRRPARIRLWRRCSRGSAARSFGDGAQGQGAAWIGRGYHVRRGGATEFGALAGSVWSWRRWALCRAAAQLALGTERRTQQG